MALSLAACGGSSTPVVVADDDAAADPVVPVVVTPVNAAFTTGFDTLVGTSGNDSFAGLQSGAATETLSSFDSVDGGAGTDSINIVNSAGAAFAGPAMTSIEEVTYRASAAGGDLDFDDIAGATSVILKGTVGATDFSDVLTTQSVSLVDSGAALNTTITYKASTVEGASDSATLNVDDAGNSGAGDIELAGDVETITITSTGEATRIDDLVLDAQTTALNITATADFRVDTLLTAAGVTTITVKGAGAVRLDDGGAAVTTFNAADATGAVHAVFDEATNVTATGGAGNDTFDFGATLTKNDTIDGGAGNDTLIVTPTGAVNGDLSVSNVETLRIGDVTASTNLDMDNVAGLTAVRLTDGTASNITTLRDIATTVATLNYTGAGSVTANSAFDTVVTDYDATADIDLLTVNITNGGTTTSGDVEVVTGSEFDGANKVVINASDWGTGTGDVVTLNTINADSANEIEINSNTDVSVTIAGMGGAAAADRLETVDASGSDAGITMTITSDDDADVTLGDGNDNFNGGAGDETILGGAGNDIIEGDGGADTMTGGAGIDTFEIDFGGEGADIITDFTAGSGGDVFDFLGTSDVNGAADQTFTAYQEFATMAAWATDTAANALDEFDGGLVVIGANVTAGTGAALVTAAGANLVIADTANAGAATADDVLYIAIDDGTDTFLFKFDSGDTDGTIDADDTITLIATLEGIADATTLSEANFADFIA